MFMLCLLKKRFCFDFITMPKAQSCASNSDFLLEQTWWLWSCSFSPFACKRVNITRHMTIKVFCKQHHILSWKLQHFIFQNIDDFLITVVSNTSASHHAFYCPSIVIEHLHTNTLLITLHYLKIRTQHCVLKDQRKRSELRKQTC